MSIRCPLCGDGQRREIALARRITPIAELLKDLTELRLELIGLGTAEVSNTGSLPTPLAIFVPNRPQSGTVSSHVHPPNSPASEGSSPHVSLHPSTHNSDLTESGSMTSSKLRSKLGLGRKDKRIPSPVLQPISATLSVDAMSLIAWSSKTASCYVIHSQQWCPCVHATAIFLAVGGVKHFAVASQPEGSQVHLHTLLSHRD